MADQSLWQRLARLVTYRWPSKLGAILVAILFWWLVSGRA
jgi:hypothetical protein